ncbi:histone deacetylase family protein [Myxococcus xanthus]|uniref:Histone deacetylase n=1 Tax=Myxococcus xanthus TaxID=34 RepID=A0A7Y4MRI9_MYXXA|nr:histone deacetylase [Myxococcus xanthus]NOJ78538.1 histone deacetylase [Myxococcus xanthus]NOJ85208.1 histone deacetylase [Myxococcus xanthus]
MRKVIPMSSTLLLTDPLFFQHDPGQGHPESPSRLRRILGVLASTPVKGTVMTAPRSATEAELASVHTPELLAYLQRINGHRAQIDPDTQVSPDSVDAARLAAGASVQAVEAVMKGEARNGFALVRPPGHHAEPDKAMGFCLYNNAAIAAEAGRKLGAERVLVLDWDVHHGNGTQAAFWSRRDVMYQSVHQFPYFPGTGAAPEVGVGAGEGYTVNVGLPGGNSDADYGMIFEELLLPVAEAYRPQLILVSAGFDAHQHDPIGGMDVSERGFAAMCSAMKSLADSVCQGRLVLLLEGGYSLEGLSQSVHACVEVLAGRKDSFPAGDTHSDAKDALRASREALRPYWPRV